MRANRYLAGAVLFLGVSALLSQCDNGTKSTTTAVSATGFGGTAAPTCPVGQTFSFTAAGGTFTFTSLADPAVSATLVVPANAVTSTTDVTIAPACGAPANASLMADTAFEVAMPGVTLASPATLTLKYDPVALGAIPASGLNLVEVVAGVWSLVTGATLNTTTDTLTAPLSGGGTWGIWLSCVNGTSVPVANGTLTCNSGAYTLSCTAGFGNCDGNMANGCETPLNTLSNCGACGALCPAINDTPVCAASVCTISSCSAGFANCNGLASDGCETNVMTDLNNCGTCGHFCAAPFATPACLSGACIIASCFAGYGDCDLVFANGCETNLMTSATSCGTCGHVCSGGTPICVSGVCASSCTDGIKDGAETGVDCGGGTCPTCATGVSCLVNSDCTSGTCNIGTFTCL